MSTKRNKNKLAINYQQADLSDPLTRMNLDNIFGPGKNPSSEDFDYKPPLPRYLDFDKNKDMAKRKNLMIAGVDASSMYYPTEKGFFLDGSGEAYMQTEGKFYEAGEYNPDIHGLPVPLANRKKLKIGTA